MEARLLQICRTPTELSTYIWEIPHTHSQGIQLPTQNYDPLNLTNLVAVNPKVTTFLIDLTREGGLWEGWFVAYLLTHTTSLNSNFRTRYPHTISKPQYSEETKEKYWSGKQYVNVVLVKLPGSVSGGDDRGSQTLKSSPRTLGESSQPPAYRDATSSKEGDNSGRQFVRPRRPVRDWDGNILEPWFCFISGPNAFKKGDWIYEELDLRSQLYSLPTDQAMQVAVHLSFFKGIS